DVKKRFPLDFFLLGLFGEVGTLMDAVKKKQRDERTYVGYESSVVEELGDVLWYLSTIATHSKIELSAIVQHALHDNVANFAEPSAELRFADLQPQHVLQLKLPTSKFERTLLQLVSAIGELASANSNGELNSQTNLGLRLSKVFKILLEASNQAEVTLDRAA